MASATVVPGPAGAVVLGDDRGQEHVNFRIGFGADQRLSVNGADAGVFDPFAVYEVTVVCHEVQGQWVATTDVVNRSTGAPVFHQCGYVMAGEVGTVRATAEDVIQLSVK